jgi:tRNA (uracil-5-)-methyltransferase TRM9
MATPQADEAYEQKNVHEVYQQIAQHFSATRYKVCLSDCMQQHLKLIVSQPWPIVERFLQDLAPGSVGLDVGCGNGKNLMVNRDVFIVASDRYVIKVWNFFHNFYGY